MKLKILAQFNWAHRHVEIQSYAPGDDDIDTEDQDLIDVSTAEGWTEEAKADDGKSQAKAPDNKSKGNAPENKKA